MSLHAYEDAREQRSTFPHDLQHSHLLVGCRKLDVQQMNRLWREPILGKSATSGGGKSRH
jgi:hypothetical protein